MMNPSLTRRGFFATSAAAALALHAERAAALGAARLRRLAPLFTPDGVPTLKALAAAALDAATHAGATYCDVRFRGTRTEEWSVFHGKGPTDPPEQFVIAGVGVRALVNGYWGFAAYDDLPTVDRMAQLGTMAARQASVNAKGPARRVELASTPVVADGQWTMPVEIDPFSVSYDEKLDFMMGMGADIINQAYGLSSTASIGFVKEARTFASSDGSFTRQTVFATSGLLQFDVDPDWETEAMGGRTADFLTSAGAGWEYVIRNPFQARLAALVEDAQRSRRSKPVEIGRYDVVLDAAAMASVLDQTLTMGTELDRAMGYLANDDGSSFLDDPLTMLGAYHVGSPLVTLTANRSMVGGGATVQWDEEGVAPVEATLVDKGILTDFQTSRESASWLAPYYQKSGRTVRSSGAASAAEATQVPRAMGSNFVLAPDPARDTTFEELVAQAKSGYAIKGGSANSDFQALNGTLVGEIVYEIVNGKLGQAVSGAQLAFRAPEFWKNVAALGGARSAVALGAGSAAVGAVSARPIGRRNFTPHFKTSYTIQAVPALITQQAMTDYTRRT